MEEFDQREYQTVILAALLHDIGKLIHRKMSGYEGKHYEASYDFLKNDKFNNLKELYDIELVRLLVRHHHDSNKEIKSELEKLGKSTPEQERMLALIKVVKDADSYSCIEREKREDQDANDKEKRRTPLDSIFSYINLEPEDIGDKDIKTYPLKLREPLESFPTNEKLLTDDDIKTIVDSLNKNLPDFKEYSDFDEVINILLDLLEKYTWAVPSDTRYKISDISLFDHLRTSAAAAACLYKSHVQEINEKKERWDRQYEFVFVGGDFSGIQDYIFNITSNETGGVSKRLRARSLFISLFSEVIIHRILHAFKLPFVCNLFSAGGKFLLILPKQENTISELKEIKKAIEEDIHNKFFSQFSFLLSWLDTRYFKKDFEVRNFFEIADRMFHELETQKLMKSKELFSNSKSLWNTSAFRADDKYESYIGNADCKVCGKGPALFSDSENPDKNVCSNCYIDKKFIGESLPKIKFIAFGKGIVDSSDDVNKIPLLRTSHIDHENKKESYYIELLKDYRQSNEHYMLYKIGSGNAVKGYSNFAINKFLANHVPKDDKNNILDFGQIAKVSIREEDNKRLGSDFLGILKADIDNLGLLFSKGFEISGKGDDKANNIDRKTVSRYLTLSRMIDMFFSGWMKDIMTYNKNEIIEELLRIEGIEPGRFKIYLNSSCIDFGKIYTVYSGGDDLVLVGPWETMIVFSIYLNQQFRKYTCNNDSITLSAGLTFIKPKHPVASAIKQADVLLCESKEKKKDRITLFGTTAKWVHLPDLINFFLFLNEKTNDENSNINTSFLHRLLKYHSMALEFLDKDEIKGLRYMSALSYDLGRNIVERDKEKNIIKGNEELKVLEKLINKTPDKDSLIYNCKLPLFWALYRNRRAWAEINNHDILQEVK